MTKVTALKFWKPIPAVLACVLTAACASSGGGGGAGSPQPPQPPPPQPQSSPPLPGYETPVSGAVGRPAAAVFSGLPVPPPTSSPKFVGSDCFPADCAFALVSSSLQSTSGGLSPVSGQGALVSVHTPGGDFSDVRLIVPALNLDTEISNRIRDLPHWLNYASLSIWEEPKSASNNYSITAFAYGYETPKTAMPSGTGEFSGVVDGIVLKPVDGNIRKNYLNGLAGFTVNFTSGKIIGAFTGIKEYAPGASSTSAWNDVSVTATIAGASNRFSGTTAASSKPDTTFGLSGSATGHINGAFYGPTGEQIGAVWSLSDGVGSALGTVGAFRCDGC